MHCESIFAKNFIRLKTRIVSSANLSTVVLSHLKCIFVFLHVVIIRSPVNQSVCAGGTVNFTCVVMFTSGSSGPAFWYTNDGVGDASRKPGHSVTYDSNGRSAPANVTTVLTVTNVGISDNGADYFCAQGFNGTRSDTVFLTVFGELSMYVGICVYSSPTIDYSCTTHIDIS